MRPRDGDRDGDQDAASPELFDLYDADGRPLGVAKPRDEAHRDGDWHRSAHVWIYTAVGALVFQRRAFDKDTWPGRLDASVGGHYRAGEDPEDGVRREVWEELGFEPDPAHLALVARRRVESREPGIADRELQDIYLLRRDLPLTAYRPDPVELAALALLDARDAARLHAGEIERAEAHLLPVGAARPHAYSVTAADLIPGRGPYLAVVAHAVTEALAGRTAPVSPIE